ncbi:MAG: PilZ domain-containing protein [Polyangiaceae bacterium]|nr:PilZ domain-containing protein [Polyangiaceae bacterium]
MSVSKRESQEITKSAVDPPEMNTPAEILVFGQFARKEQACLKEAARASAISIYRAQSAHEAGAWLETHQPKAILLSDGADDPMGIALGTRAQSRHRALPILALANEPSDLVFTGAFSWGADDVVSPERPSALTQRLRALLSGTPQNQNSVLGTAVVAEPYAPRRIAMARALSNAGYQVLFAVNKEDAMEYSRATAVGVAIVSSNLCDDPEAFIRAAQERSPTNVIFSTEPRDFDPWYAHLGQHAQARVPDASSPPENVVFLANELLRDSVQNLRQSPRFLYGTSIRFRSAGTEEDEIGFTYNISEGGLYIRTLAPPAEDRLWLELKPPHQQTQVRLVGEVVWRRKFGSNESATVPPGFAVRITEAAPSDLSTWVEACRRAS